MSEVRRATPDDAAVLGRMLWDFNTEFETETDDADRRTLQRMFRCAVSSSEMSDRLSSGGSKAPLNESQHQYSLLQLVKSRVSRVRAFLRH